MPEYGKPQTFTLDYDQMNHLIELLDPLFKSVNGMEIQDAGRWEVLRALRDQIHRHLD